MRYRIEHETRLAFEQPVQEHQCELRLHPREDPLQQVHSFSVVVEPATELFTYKDAFGNLVHHFGIISPHRELVTRIHMEVETKLDNPFDYIPLEPAEEEAWYRERLVQEPNLWQYILHESTSTPSWATLQTASLHAPSRDRNQSVQASLLAAMRWVRQTLAYRTGVTDTHNPLTAVLEQRAGVCQDFAHLFLSLVRSWGLPARYVMGYLDSGILADNETPSDPASHAWVDVLIPKAGWRGFDATHDLVAGNNYIPVAVGRDSLDAAPQRGSFKGNDAGPAPQVKLLVAQQQ